MPSCTCCWHRHHRLRVHAALQTVDAASTRSQSSWPAKSACPASSNSIQAHQSQPFPAPIPASSSSASSIREMSCSTGPASQPALPHAFVYLVALSLTTHAPSANTSTLSTPPPPPRAPPALSFFPPTCVCASPPPFVYRRTELHRAPSFHSLPTLSAVRLHTFHPRQSSRSRRPRHCHPHSSPSHEYTSNTHLTSIKRHLAVRLYSTDRLLPDSDVCDHTTTPWVFTSDTRTGVSSAASKPESSSTSTSVIATATGSR